MRRTKLPAALFLILLVSAAPALADNRSSYTWDPVKPVDPETHFFGETPQKKEELSDAPKPSDKSYPWYCLEKGNSYFLNHEYENASHYFKAAYGIAGPTRVMSGFRLIDAYQKLDWINLALETLDQMEEKYLISSREFREAARVRAELEDRKRRGVKQRKPEPFTGREWLLQTGEWRLHYVHGAMKELSRHGIPLKEQAHGYVFLLDEFLTAHPATDTDDAVSVLADLVYERDQDARIPIDRWRADPEGTVTEEIRAEEALGKRFTGAEWITMLHEDKMDYVSAAIDVLKDQRVPMEKGLHAYTDALDVYFTEKPGLPASDSVRALASLLYETEPEARKVLEALRLE